MRTAFHIDLIWTFLTFIREETSALQTDWTHSDQRCVYMPQIRTSQSDSGRCGAPKRLEIWQKKKKKLCSINLLITQDDQESVTASNYHYFNVYGKSGLSCKHLLEVGSFFTGLFWQRRQQIYATLTLLHTPWAVLTVFPARLSCIIVTA